MYGKMLCRGEVVPWFVVLVEDLRLYTFAETTDVQIKLGVAVLRGRPCHSFVSECVKLTSPWCRWLYWRTGLWPGNTPLGRGI